MSMNVRNTVAFILVAGFVGYAYATPPGGGGGHGGPPAGGGGPVVNHPGPPGGGHPGGPRPGGHHGGGHHGGGHHGGPPPVVPPTPDAPVNNNGGAVTVLPGYAPSQPIVVQDPVTPYPCPPHYHPTFTEGTPFGYHGCRLDPDYIRKIQDAQKEDLIKEEKAEQIKRESEAARNVDSEVSQFEDAIKRVQDNADALERDKQRDIDALKQRIRDLKEGN